MKACLSARPGGSWSLERGACGCVLALSSGAWLGRRSRMSTSTLAEARALLTAKDVAAMLGVPTSWVYEQSRLGRIPTVTLGRYRRYRAEAIAAWVAQLEAPAGGL